VDHAVHFESQNGVANPLKIPIAFGIVLALLLVNRAINLHDQACAETQEIDDVRTNRMLPSEQPTIDLSSAHNLPDPLLRVCKAAPEIARGCPRPNSSCDSLTRIPFDHGSSAPGAWSSVQEVSVT
jgi:hypothetical protein